MKAISIFFFLIFFIPMIFSINHSGIINPFEVQSISKMDSTAIFLGTKQKEDIKELIFVEDMDNGINTKN